jgi:hypothetical protein
LELIQLHIGVINKLENIQLDAARIVTGGTRLTSHDSLYEETKWEKLKSYSTDAIWRFNKVSNKEVCI